MFNTEHITFFVGKEKLSGILYSPSSFMSPLPAAITYHGRGSSKNRHLDRAQAFAEAGFLSFVFDFRGCGDSDGEFDKQTTAMGLEDALAAYEYIFSHKLVDKNRIAIWGGSYGGYQAALVSEMHPVKSLVLAAPALYVNEWWNITISEIRNDEGELYRLQEEMNILNTKGLIAIEKYSGSLFVEVHENDEIIPRRIPQAYFHHAHNTQAKDMKIMKDAPHALYDEIFRKQSIEWATDWFKKTL